MNTKFSDQELLEQTARLLGIDILEWNRTNGQEAKYWMAICRPHPTLVINSVWNPLLDDGDAFRLGVTLEKKYAFMSARLWITKLDLDDYAENPGRAIRHAFVKAAADLWRENTKILTGRK